MNNQSFCKFFKNGLVINNDTTHFTVAPCCYYKTNSTIDPKNANFQLIENRNQWLTSDIKKECHVCIEHEASNLPSYRQTSFDIVKDETDEIVFLTIAVNKKCNLACLTCDANSSSYWYQENIRNQIKQPQNVIKLHKDDRDGIINDNFLKLFQTLNLTKLKYIKFGGGEPFMSDTHFEILKLIPNPENVQIQYTSNFSIMPSKKIFSIWEKFQLVKWAASLDGINEQFEILRWPYQWEKFLEFKDLAIKLSPVNVMFAIEHTLNPLNIFYFDQFEDWVNNNFYANRLGDNIDLNLHVANGVVGLDKTPISLRDLVYKKYGSTHKISLLLQQTSCTDNQNLIQFLDELDNARNLNWRNTFSEIQNFYV